MSRAKGLLALLLVAIVVALVFLPRGGGPPDNATMAHSIALFGYADDGEPLWEIRAEDGRIDDASQTLNGVAIDFFAEDQGPLQIRGDRLERSEATSRLSGNVRIERTDELLLTTDELTWDEADERLAAGPIELVSGDLRMSAAEFGYDLEHETASFGGGVEASADLETDWSIRADRAEEHDGVVAFLGGVDAESVDGRLAAESLRVDENGIRAVGGVSARLDMGVLRESDGT
jgi:hypothetical protein